MYLLACCLSWLTYCYQIQGASVMMATFSQDFLPLQNSILLQHYHPDIGSKCACSDTKALFRCAGSECCFDSNLLCKSCILEQHKKLPFHHIEVWNSAHFVDSSLESMGFVLHLGYYGEPCPNGLPSAHPRVMVIVHTNGYHKLPVSFCQCYGAMTEAIQLSNQKLFPATIEQPQTGFSFVVLNHFHQFTLSSKKSLYDYVDALVKLTNATFPQDVLVSLQIPGLPETLITDRYYRTGIKRWALQQTPK